MKSNYEFIFKVHNKMLLSFNLGNKQLNFLFLCLQMFGLQNIVSLDCCRIVKYDEYQDTLERSFEGEECTPMGKLLGGVKQTYNFDMLLETKRPDQVFQEYKPGGKYMIG